MSLITASFLGNLGNVWSNIWPIIVAIIMFAFLIFIHEFGHFSVAKLLKVRVNEFAIGFGPKLLKWKKGETAYSLRLFPFGGFCAMEGEDETSTDSRAFCNKPVWRRVLIVMAGAFNNLVLGLLLLMIMLSIVGSFGTTTIASFSEDAYSNLQDGLMVGDKIVEIDTRNIYSVSDISYMLMNSRDSTVDFTVIRNGQKTSVPGVNFETVQIEGRNFIKLDLKVEGEKVSISRPFSFIKEAFLRTVSMARLVWMSIFDLVTGRYGINEIMGPVGTISTVGQAARIDFPSLLNIMALITINLGVFNLLPIPALDGGRIVFLGVEAIRRKPVPPKYEGLVHTIGLALLLTLILVITGNDILRLIRGG